MLEKEELQGLVTDLGWCAPNCPDVRHPPTLLPFSLLLGSCGCTGWSRAHSGQGSTPTAEPDALTNSATDVLPWRWRRP